MDTHNIEDRINRTARALGIAPEELRKAMMVAGLAATAQAARAYLAEDLEAIIGAQYVIAAQEVSEGRDRSLIILSDLIWRLTLHRPATQAPHPTARKSR